MSLSRRQLQSNDRLRNLQGEPSLLADSKEVRSAIQYSRYLTSGGNMANLESALRQLREERKQAQVQLEKLDSAITVLEGIGGRNSTAPRRGARPGRTVSPAARRRMARAQKARWARVRGRSQSSGRRKSTSSSGRVLSPAARKKIADAQRARWARVRAQQAKKAA